MKSLLKKKKEHTEAIPLMDQPPTSETPTTPPNDIIPVPQKKKNLDFSLTMGVFLFMLNGFVFSLWGIQSNIGTTITSIYNIPLWRLVIIIDIITTIHQIFKLIFHYTFQIFSKQITNKKLLHLYYHTSPFEHCLSVGTSAVVTLSIYNIALLPVVRQDTSLLLWSLVTTYFAVCMAYVTREVITKFMDYITFREMRDSIYEVVWREQILKEFENSSLVPVELMFEEDLSLLGKSQSVLVNDMNNLVGNLEMTPEDAAEKVIKDNIFKGNRVAFTKDDIKDIFGHSIPRIWEITDQNKDGEIHFGEFKTLLISVWTQRKSLQNWVQSRSLLLTITNQMTQFFYWNTVVFLVMALFIEQFYNLPWDTLLASIGTMSLALSFAYGKVLQDMFASLSLIFWVKPYAVGDSIRIGDSTDTLQVEKVRIMFTFFQHSGGYGVCIPNAVLATSKIINLHRGHQVSTSVPFQISIHTTLQQISTLNEKIQKYISTKDSFTSVSIRVDSTEKKEKFFNVNLFVKFRKRIKYTDDEWRRELSYMVVVLNQELYEMGINLPSKYVLGSSKEPLIHL